MLTPVDQTAASSSGPTTTPDSSVMCMFYGTTGTLIYTVPTGRKFKGYFWPAGVNYDGFVVLAGGTLTNNQNVTLSNQSSWPPYSEANANGTTELTLHAGDALYTGPYSNYRARVVGVESDA